MIIPDFTDTIAAISTPNGMGGIAVIRVSGKETFNICSKIFKSKSNSKLEAQEGNTILFGNIVDEDNIIDEVLLSIFKNPKSYTGEDTIEISCHGSTFIQQQILQVLIKNGARLAKPGEFTQRAFMSGKLDLSQAEAVGDLIAAQSQASHDVAIQQMRGGFSHEIKELRQKLLDFTSLIELELDFSEEDVEFANRDQLKELINNIETSVDSLIDSFSVGNAIKNGIPIAIVGEPNVGKSTLLNSLLNEEKAIVSDIPGTTRDSIEDTFIYNGILFRFTDTAGLRDTEDTIETIGIKRTYSVIEKASIVLYLFDANTTSKEQADEIVNNILSQEKYSDKHFIKVFNKIDKAESNASDNEDSIYISAKAKQNITLLKDKILEASHLRSINTNETIVTNARHYEALIKTKEFIDHILQGLNNEIPTDLLTIDIRSALHYLGEITGEITTDDVLGNIFANFCIGK